MTGVIDFSDGVKPGVSALVESVRKRSTPSSPSRAKARRSVIRPSSGSWSILKSPVCSTSPAPVRIATASASGMEWLTATNSSSNGPNVSRSPSLTTWCTVSRSRCSRSLLSSSARVSSEPTSGMSPPLAEEVRRRADVVLVAVGEDQRLDLVEAVPDRAPVGEDQVDAGLVVLGEQHAAVDDQQPAVVLEDGHVAADLAEAAERDDPEAPLRQGGRCGELGMGVAQVSPCLQEAGRRESCSQRGHLVVVERHQGRRGRCGCRARRAAGALPWRWWLRSWGRPSRRRSRGAAA